LKQELGGEVQEKMLWPADKPDGLLSSATI
jgi:hypothetical protein